MEVKEAMCHSRFFHVCNVIFVWILTLELWFCYSPQASSILAYSNGSNNLEGSQMNPEHLMHQVIMEELLLLRFPRLYNENVNGWIWQWLQDAIKWTTHVYSFFISAIVKWVSLNSSCLAKSHCNPPWEEAVPAWSQDLLGPEEVCPEEYRCAAWWHHLLSFIKYWVKGHSG